MAQPRRHHEVLRLAPRQVAQQPHSTVLIIPIFVVELLGIGIFEVMSF